MVESCLLCEVLFFSVSSYGLNFSMPARMDTLEMQFETDANTSARVVVCTHNVATDELCFSFLFFRF